MKFIYSQWTEQSATDEQRLDQVMRLFNYLVLQTSGDVDQAMEWLRQLAEEYGIFDDNLTMEELIQKLKELGLIEEVHLDEAHHHYEIKNSRDHHHLICLGCGKVVEFESPATIRMMKEVGREKDFQIINTEVRMTGYCEVCRKKTGNP